MPKSKTRKPSAPRRALPDKPAAALPPEKALEIATLALVQASQECVREAEAKITLAARGGDQDQVDEALEIHHWLRTASLGLLVSYSKMAGLPDPRENVM